jgi:type IV secretory pathway VirB6-like protein
MVCSADKELEEYGFGNALVGWGRNCAVSAGEQSPSSTSCISTGNIMGQLIDTITTLGIGITMRDNFCSFSPHQPHDQEEGRPGGWSRDSQYLEGAILNKSFIKLCDNISPEDKYKTCMKCILKGKWINNNGDGCQDPTADTPDPLQLHLHIADGKKDKGGLCYGIPNLDKPLLTDKGAPIYQDNKQVYCPLLRCNIPTNNIKVKYRDGVCCNIMDLKNNTIRGASLSGIIRIKRVFEGDRVCAQMKFTTGYRTLACKARIPPEINMPETACFIKGLPAFRPDGLQSKWLFPITSKVVQTITEVLDSMFKGIPGCQGGVTYFQNSMKSIVRALLILYVIFFGFKVATSKEMVGKRDLFMFVLKFALVVYFSVGSFGTTTDLSDNNGLLFVRKGVVAVMTSFSNMIIGAASPELCDFSKIQYADGYDYLKLWDSIDCKLSFYLGFASPTEYGFYSRNESGIFKLIWALFSGANFLIIIFLFCLGLFLLSIVTYFTYLYVIAMIAITIMIFFGPIFIPLALFDQTKGYFDKWRGVLLGYALQPVVVVAVIAVMIATFDMVIYSDCKFDQRNLQGGKPYWILRKDNQSDTCRNSFGRYLITMGESSHTSSVPADGDNNQSLFKYDVATDMDGIKDGLLLSTFFAFLFYFFAGQIGALASELGGSFSFDSAAISPTGLLTAAGTTAKGALDAVGARLKRHNKEKQDKKEEAEYEKKEEEKRKKEEEEKKKEEEEKKKEEEEKKRMEEEEKAAAERKAAAEKAAADKKAAEDAQGQ